jgi:hypothetical protein
MLQTFIKTSVLFIILACAIKYVIHTYDSIDDKCIKYITDYSDFIKNATTGDLIFVSNVEYTSPIRAITGSVWSHCGILYKDPKTNILYEWSSHSKSECYKSNKNGSIYNGVQLIELQKVVVKNGFIGWKRLSLSNVQRKLLIKHIQNTIYKVPFANKKQLISSITHLNIFNKEECNPGMACSHLLAYVLSNIVAITIDRPINTYIPKDFADDSNSSIKWLTNQTDNQIKMVVGFDMSNFISLYKK